MGSRVRRDATRTPVGSGLREEGTGVHVTATACEALSKLLERRATPDRCLRLSTNQGNYRFIIDEPIEHDIVYNFEGRVVLVVSETVSRDLWGITVDTTPEADGKQKLIFRKAKAGEPLDAVRDDAPMVPPGGVQHSTRNSSPRSPT